MGNSDNLGRVGKGRVRFGEEKGTQREAKRRGFQAEILLKLSGHIDKKSLDDCFG